MMQHIERIALGDQKLHELSDQPLPAGDRFDGLPGIAHTLSVSGTSLILGANAPNVGSMYIMLAPFEEAKVAI